MIRFDLIREELNKHCTTEYPLGKIETIKDLMKPIENQYCDEGNDYTWKYLCDHCRKTLIKYQILYNSFILGFNNFIEQSQIDV